MDDNIKLVNNTGAALGQPFESALIAAVNNGGVLPEELADIFHVEVLKGYNPDGSNRGIVTWA